MNLMFWKKKHDAGSRAEEAEGDSSVNKEVQEPLDSIAEAPESNPESPEQERSESSIEPPAQESPVKTGLVARMKSKFTSFARYFSKAPAFQAGEGSVSDAHGSSDVTPDDIAAKNPDPEISDQKTPVKPGLIAQINSKFSALALRFKKAPVPDAEENQGEDTHHRSKESSDGAKESTIKLGVVAQIKAKLAAMTLRFKRAPEPAMAEDRGKKTPRRSKDDAGDTEEASEPSLISLVKSLLAAFVSYYKKHLIFTLLLLSLSGIVYNAWDIIFPPLVRKPTPHNVAKPRIHEPAPQTDAEAIKKKSEEAQARADTLKKESEEAQIQAEALKKASEEAQAKAEELSKKEEEEKTRAEELRKKEEEEKAGTEALKKNEEEEKARTEALKKKNAEEKTRADALKKSSRQTGEVTTSFTSKGEVAVGSNDPKATAKSLKEAIEAMNNGSSGRTLPKPAK